MNHLQSLKFESKLYAMVKDKMEEMQQHNMSWIEVDYQSLYYTCLFNNDKLSIEAKKCTNMDKETDKKLKKKTKTDRQKTNLQHNATRMRSYYES